MIFVPMDATVYYAAAVPTRFSDHHMVLAEVEVSVPRTDRSPRDFVPLGENGDSAAHIGNTVPRLSGRAVPVFAHE